MCRGKNGSTEGKVVSLRGGVLFSLCRGGDCTNVALCKLDSQNSHQHGDILTYQRWAKSLVLSGLTAPSVRAEIALRYGLLYKSDLFSYLLLVFRDPSSLQL